MITNYTREPLRRINFNLPVDFLNDLDKVETVDPRRAQGKRHVLKTPEPWVGVSELQEYAVLMFVRCYIKSDDYWKALPSIQKDVKAALDRNNILIAVTRQAVAERNEPETRLNRATTEPSETRREAAERNPARRSPASGPSPGSTRYLSKSRTPSP